MTVDGCLHGRSKHCYSLRPVLNTFRGLRPPMTVGVTDCCPAPWPGIPVRCPLPVERHHSFIYLHTAELDAFSVLNTPDLCRVEDLSSGTFFAGIGSCTTLAMMVC